MNRPAMPDTELWRFVSTSGTTLTALRREIRDGWMHPADGPFRLELRTMNGDDLHRSESFRSEQALQARSDELRQLLLERGWRFAASS